MFSPKSQALIAKRPTRGRRVFQNEAGRTLLRPEQFEKLMDTMDVDEGGIKEKVKTEVEQFKKFHLFVLGKKQRIDITDVDVRTYAKYLLREGSPTEKRELLSCLKGKIYRRTK